jgi:ribosomal protein S18 acetylase RimI-like enzyme
VDPVNELENLCADAWPAQFDEPLGQWRMRAAGGFTGRANSTLTTGDPGIPVADAVRSVAEFADRHGIARTVHVVVGSTHESAIADQGWAVDHEHPGGAESTVLTGPLRDFAGPKSEEVSIAAVAPTEWWEMAASAVPTAAQRHVLGSGADVGFGAVTRDGRVVAAVRGAVVGDLLHIARLAVRPSHRRLGLARDLLAGLASWGLAHGATYCALQVADQNLPALRLYGSLGCVEHHKYRYWVPTTGA